MSKKGWRFKDILIAVIVVLAISLTNLIRFFADWVWFASVGYESVFLTVVLTSIGLGLFFGLIFLIFSMVNTMVAYRLTGKKNKKGKGFMIAALLILSVIIGISFSSWQTVLTYLNASPFGISDPVFGLDVSFYVFTLPFYSMLYWFGLATLCLTIIVTFIVYLFRSNSIRKVEILSADILTESPQSNVEIKWNKIPDLAYKHLSVLLGLLFLVFSFGFVLGQWGLLFTGGTVYGAGYADLAVGLPVLQIMSVISVITALVFFANAKLFRTKVALGGIGLLIIVGILGAVAMGVTQAFVVSPNEFNLEQPYIERNILLTNKAYGIDKFEVSEFPISYDLTIDDIEQNRETIDNIRLWDWRPLSQTYEQLQLFRTYYRFYDVDVARYDINNEQKQVMISARGLDINSLPENAQTWVNQHLVYTHGYGVVMIPVNNVTKEGLPEFLIKDIPPKSDYFTISRPEIYFGEGLDQYSIVKTGTEELDYPSGGQNIYTTYEGSGGILLSEGLNRLLFALRFASIDMLFSGSITPESRLLINRDTTTRSRIIAPFLQYDYDPYILISEGKLYWLLDAYSSSNNYPYSEPIMVGKRESINYIRNSVKVLVDAYSGELKFYVIDKEDPVIRTYMKIFPDLFHDFAEMDPGIKIHVRYPEGLFSIQAELYSTYHMTDPRVFYNKEDVWITPNEIYRGDERMVEPYYIITKLPGNEKEEFSLIKPFVPRGKQNLIGWMAARSDDPNYGKVQIYQFSKQELAFGPMQIEARIDQDTEISQKITLWSQSGSSVVRGNTLVIPVKNSILYIEPIFLEATAGGTLPELKRVIVAYENKISMQPTLEEALRDIFGVSEEQPPTVETPETSDEVLKKVSELYNKAQEALKEGNLVEYAEYIEEMGKLLE